MGNSLHLDRPLLAAVALLAAAGVALQLLVAARIAAAAGGTTLVGILAALGYFTVLTNLLVAVLATLRVLRSWPPRLPASATLAATAVYILVVGLIYSLLLRSLWAPSGLHKLADMALHDLVPVAYLAWWLACAPKDGLHWSHALWWLGYPLAYFAVSLLAGAVTGRYLYAFADVGALGLATAVRNAAGVLVLFWVLGLLAVSIGRRAPRPGGAALSARARSR